MQTAEQILAIAPIYARELFSGDEKAVKSQFKKLVQLWHPDHNPAKNAAEVFQHINELKSVALRQLGSKSIPLGRERLYEAAAGTKSRFSYLVQHVGDLGDILISSKSLVYEIANAYQDVTEAEVDAVANLSYADDKMRDEISRYMPKLTRRLTLVDKDVLFFERPADTILLTDLVRHFDGKIPAVHVAWIVSAALNLACYLGWAGRVHGAISQETLLICPSKHSVMLVGGWGYSCATKTRPNVLPRRTTSQVPRLAIAGEVATPKVDIDLIKATAQEILGAPGGTGLKMMADIPDPLIDWLLSPSSDNAVAEYKGWMETLHRAFGQRRFVDMKVVPADVYATLAA
jgi:hypothetical protein